MTPITEVEGRRLALSNLDKVLYPATGTTKGEVLHYYAATAAGSLLAHLYNRPVSFLRYPDGPDGQRFFTKNPHRAPRPGYGSPRCRGIRRSRPNRCSSRIWRR